MGTKVNNDEFYKVYVYPDGEQYTERPEWKSDDYEIRETSLCEICDSEIQVHYMEPLASCDCCTQEWYK